MAPLTRERHTDRNRRTGRYRRTELCDGCNWPVGTAYFTDYEVCGDSDGPGFYLCDRKLCVGALEGLSVEQRRAWYTKMRAKRAEPKPEPKPTSFARGTLAFYDDPPFLQATYKEQPCGCEIVGNGTLPHPLTIKRCPKHEAAGELFDTLWQIVDAYDKGIGVTLPKTSLALAREIIAKVKGRKP